MDKQNLQESKKKEFGEKIKKGVSKIGTLNIVLIFVGGYMVYINFEMLKVFKLCGAAPESAWCALIAALLGECGICGWIKTSKEKHRARSRDEPGSGDAGDGNMCG